MNSCTYSQFKTVCIVTVVRWCCVVSVFGANEQTMLRAKSACQWLFVLMACVRYSVCNTDLLNYHVDSGELIGYCAPYHGKVCKSYIKSSQVWYSNVSLNHQQSLAFASWLIKFRIDIYTNQWFDSKSDLQEDPDGGWRNEQITSALWDELIDDLSELCRSAAEVCKTKLKTLQKKDEAIATDISYLFIVEIIVCLCIPQMCHQRWAYEDAAVVLWRLCGHTSAILLQWLGIAWGETGPRHAIEDARSFSLAGLQITATIQ